MATKQRALEAYAEEMRQFPHPRSSEAIAGACVHGAARAPACGGGGIYGRCARSSLEFGRARAMGSISAGRAIGSGEPPYVVAELSANHGGRLDRALAVMEAAKAAGADAIKLQTYTADTITIDHDGPDFRIKGGLWDGRRLYDLYEEAHTPWDWHAALFAKGRELGIPVFSTPFDDTAVDFLETFDPPAYKIASFETGRSAADSPHRRDRPADDHVDRHGDAGRDRRDGRGVPRRRRPRPRAAALRQRLSDAGRTIEPAPHSRRSPPSSAVRSASPTTRSASRWRSRAVALGACLIEKHFTLRRADGGPDAAFSLEPDELAALVHGSTKPRSRRSAPGPARSEVETEQHDVPPLDLCRARHRRGRAVHARRTCASSGRASAWRRGICRRFSASARAARSRAAPR